MRAAVMRDYQMVVEDVPDPTPGPGQVLVRTLACGICGSDLHYLRHLDRMIAVSKRTRPDDETLDPHRSVVMGHEFCAEIVGYGPDTQRTLAVGSRVASMPVVISAAGIGAVGYSHDYPGGYGELMVLSEGLVLPVPNDVPTDIAALTEPMAVGLHAVNKARLTPDDVALVIGCGPIGLAVIAWLRAKGVAPVVAADFSPARRALALRMGAHEVLDPAAGSPYARWEDLAWPPGADRANPMVALLGPKPRPGVVFECVGVPGVLNNVLEGAMRDTRVVVVGVCMEDDRIEPILGIGKEISLQFVLAYTPEEFAETLAALAAGTLVAEPIITGRVGIDAVPQAFTDLGNPEAHAKILVVPGR